ncbi:energy transducer TonB [Propionivibrio sp.]|uniref:energy transducer TonB n=1 Tax=Propionivibrio sp. TaxID=2212460 RepID=UPI0025E89E90|nr:energy transducer TonB [Propionivibrio sp.]
MKDDAVELASHQPPPEESNVTSLILSALVHLLLIAALFLGVQWKSRAPSSVEVEVWRAAPVAAPVAKREPIAEPPPVAKPEPRPEPKPVPRVEPAPTIKPDIAIKDEKKPKKEETKKPEPKKEESKKPEPKKEEPKKPEPKKEEPKKPEPERRSSFEDELKRDLKQTQQQKVAQEQRARAEAEANLLAQLKSEQASAGRARGLADYAAKVRGKIRGNIVLPPAIQGNPEAVFEVTQLPSGEVLSVKVRKSSGNLTLDAAIERAILKSSPLPKPDDPGLFERVLKIPYRPLDE